MEDDELRRSDARREEWANVESGHDEEAVIRKALLSVPARRKSRTSCQRETHELTARVPAALYERFVDACTDEGTDVTTVLVNLLERYVEQADDSSGEGEK